MEILSTEKIIMNRFNRSGGGAVFTSGDFLRLGTRTAVDKSLSRLVAEGKLRRVARGIYYLPATNPFLGEISPDIETIVSAVTRSKGINVMADGATSANRLGLSNHVPATTGYLTNGNPFRLKVGKMEISFSKAAPRKFLLKNPVSATVAQALTWISKEQVSPEMISRLRENLSSEKKKCLRQDAHKVPAWIGKIFLQIAQ